MGGFHHGSRDNDDSVLLAGGGYKSVSDFLLSQDHYKTSPGAGTAGTSSATSGSTLSVPYVTVNANGHVTAYGTHTHTITGFLTAHLSVSNSNPNIKYGNTMTIGSVGGTNLLITLPNNEGTSDFTDSTELLTSYASNNGFADTNAPGVIYRRKAVSMYNYLVSKGFLTAQDHYKTSPGAGTAGTSSATSGSTLSVPYVTINANGHITGYGTHTHTISGFLTALDHYKTSPGAGTAGTSSDTSGATLAVPYVTVNANGHVTGYGTHTHSVTAVVGSYTSNGGQQNPNYFGKNRVGFLMMNTTINSNSQYKDWIIMDCYNGNDVGGGVAFGVNRLSLGAYIMRSASGRASWAESAELIGTHNYTTYCATASHNHDGRYVKDYGGNVTGKIYDIPCKTVFSGLSGSSYLTDGPSLSNGAWMSGLVLGSNWNNNHYLHYLVESGDRWYTTRAYASSAMKDWNTFAYLSDIPGTVSTTAAGIVPKTVANTMLYANASGTATWGKPTLFTIAFGGHIHDDDGGDFNVSYKDTFTLYAGECIEVSNDGDVNIYHATSGVTAGTAGTSSATSGSTISIPYITVEEYGHVTGKGTHTHTVNVLAKIGEYKSSSAMSATSNYNDTEGLNWRTLYVGSGPTDYGNVITIGNSGKGLLCLGWSGGQTKADGTDTNVGKLYYRSKRDNQNGWTVWKQIAYTSDIVNSLYYLTLNGSVNGTSGSTNLGTFYAPTTAGSNGLYLKSNGSGAPTWATFDNTHNHTLSIVADSGTPTVVLSANTTYKLTAGGSTLLFKTPEDQVGSGSSSTTGYWANIAVLTQSSTSKSPTFSWMYATGGAQIAYGDTSNAKLAVGGNIRLASSDNETAGFKIYFGDSSYSYIGERDGDSDDIVVFGENGVYLNSDDNINVSAGGNINISADDNIYLNSYAYTKALNVKGRILSRINAAISSSQSYSLGGGYYYAVGNPNIQFIGDNTYGISTIEFVSQKGDTTINKPSDCAFIQYQPYGSTKSSIGSQPTLTSTGESGKFIIGIHNDSDDLLCLLTPSTTGLKHVVGTNEYTIVTTGNYSALGIGGGGSSVSVTSSTSSTDTYQVVGVTTDATSSLRYLATSVGHFYFTTSGAYHTSDERMKHDIWDILQNDVDTLFGTNNGYIRHFAWNNNDVEAYGFIAQELEEFCPEAIHINEDGYYGVNYNVAFSKILGAMFKKIKQQDKEIKKLKKIIEKHK